MYEKASTLKFLRKKNQIFWDASFLNLQFHKFENLLNVLVFPVYTQHEKKSLKKFYILKNLET